MNKPVVKFTNVTKTYSMLKKKSDKLLEIFSLKQGKKGFSALSSVSFEVYKGETIGIIGINGSGKSTLSSLLAEVTPPTTGDISIDGETSLVAISAGLNNFLTGMENIELKCMMHGLTKEEIKEIKPTIIEFADIGDFINQPIKSYSSGMKSRLGFAISAHIQPDILVIDEALSVGDSTFYKKCLDKFDEFKKQGKTIFFISHSLSQVKTISDRILWLNFGQVKMFGEKDKIAAEYTKFIDWFNDLSKIEQKKYRKKMLATQKQSVNINSLEIGPEIPMKRRSNPKKEKVEKRHFPFLQLSFLLTLFVCSTILLFIDNPIEAITNRLGQATEVEDSDNLAEESEPAILTIDKSGIIKGRDVPVYLDSDLNENDIEAEVSFATKVFIEEEIDDSIYKVSVENDTISGYVETENVELIDDDEMANSTLSIETFLPLFSESIQESYAYLFAFLGADYENVKNTLRGLTDEYTNQSGKDILEYEYGAYSYYFNEDDIAETIEFDEIDVDSSIINEVTSESQISSSDDSLFYLVTAEYTVILDVSNRNIMFKIK
ncbi:ATP-binding cassette domain-containing protein [Oceanobacillus aidingensis]|uniref:ATP-binding cassette domain-containing protein n=1 Tax=Oceanobacillus aidingensis TaxID=645964 RepID=A0ABV9JUN0_9BACI